MAARDEERTLPMDQRRYRLRIRRALHRLGDPYITDDQIDYVLDQYGRKSGARGPSARFVARRALQLHELEGDDRGTVPLEWAEAWFDRPEGG